MNQWSERGQCSKHRQLKDVWSDPHILICVCFHSAHANMMTFFSRWCFSVFDNNSWTQDWVIFELWIHFHKDLLSVISMISICQSALFSYMCSSVQWEGPLSLKTSLVSPNCGELFLKVARQKGSWWEREKGNTCSASDLMHCWYKIPGSVKMGKPRWQNGRLWEHRID